WCEMTELAKPAIEALRSGRVRCHPAQQTNVMLSYLENIRPWCVSRQLWWGHRIPVWYCGEGHTTVAEEEPAACVECGSRELRQDDDVLDTWFSSALWPFAALGWPRDTEDLRFWYPTNLLSTAQEILYLWVARMIMTGLDFMHEIPFHDVYVHATILDEKGERM